MEQSSLSPPTVRISHFSHSPARRRFGLFVVTLHSIKRKAKKTNRAHTKLAFPKYLQTVCVPKPSSEEKPGWFPSSGRSGTCVIRGDGD